MRRRFVPVALVFLGSAVAPSAAELDELTARYGDELTNCYDAAADTDARLACIGVMSSTCMGTEAGGETTTGMSLCLQAERAGWDVLLNAEYRRTLAWSMSMDAEDAGSFPEFANRAKTLRDAQRAWMSFRDAECANAYAAWGSGSLRVIGAANCLMDITAKRAVALRQKRELMN